MKLGIDWGGTKIEAAVLTEDRQIIWRMRQPTPQNDYDACLRVARGLVGAADAEFSRFDHVGVGIPGSISPTTGLVRNANSQCLNGKSFETDLATALSRPVRMTNDANCFALSEAIDGAGGGTACVFGVILGTGVGGGIALNGIVHQGHLNIAGEWGHTPLAPLQDDEMPAPDCWCGRKGCIETYLSGPAFAKSYHAISGTAVDGPEIVARLRTGDAAANACFQAYISRLARGLSTIINILDPDVIVLGGGMSNVDEIYQSLPGAIKQYAFTDHFSASIKPAVHGDSSGVRGAAWLWDAR